MEHGFHIIRSGDHIDVIVDGIEVGYAYRMPCHVNGFVAEAHTPHPDGGWLVTQHDDADEAVAAVLDRANVPVAA